MLTIAVDAMGGDHAPKREVEGAVRAAEELQIGVILVGLEDVIRAELALYPQAGGLPIEVHHASEFITMEDSAAKAVKGKKDSSIRVACRLVRDGVADGVVSAGNTGAVMATSKIVQGVIRGVTRPALAGAFPSLTGSPVVLLDVGANVDCKPEMLAQFAVMGEIYSRTIFHNARPRVGLLSIGEEEHKGNDLTRDRTAAAEELSRSTSSATSRGATSSTASRTWWFATGLSAMSPSRSARGWWTCSSSMLRDSLSKTMTRKIGSMLSREAYREFKKRLDYSEYGGAPLLGVKGVCTISHGRSNANADQKRHPRSGRIRRRAA